MKILYSKGNKVLTKDLTPCETTADRKRDGNNFRAVIKYIGMAVIRVK
jgi:hypothetical protein